MINTRKNDEAVSPVIGVILMVAITVILAAVIAAFVFGMAGSITKTKVVAVTVQKPDASNIYVTYQGGQDASMLTGARVSINELDLASINKMASDPYLKVGTSVTYTKDPTAVAGGTKYIGSTTGREHVVITGHFGDGTDQVLLDTTV
jgi:archaeal type IV pilus assembly protein PilA